MLDLRTKKILVTGGGGFSGQHVIRTLIARGVPEANISIPRSKEDDLRVFENCERVVRGQNVIIHLASNTGGIEFHRAHPAVTFYDNLMMGVQLMEAARGAGVEKFVTIGSATEYPESAPLPFKEENLWDGPSEPIHIPYTVAKKMLLVEAQAYRKQYGFDAVHLLMTNMYGPGQRLERQFFIPSIVRRMHEAVTEQKKTIEVWGTGKPTRDFLYVEDAAEGIVLAAERYDKPEPVNLASGLEVTIREIVESVARIMQFQGEIVWNTEKPDGQLRRVLDASRAEREFGFKARTSLDEGLRKTVLWFTQEMHATAS